MKKWLKRGAAMVIAAVMTAQAALPALAAESGTEETLKIASLSDTHYLSPTLIKDTEDFTTHLNSDRKMFAESDAFVNALLDTIKNVAES